MIQTCRNQCAIKIISNYNEIVLSHLYSPAQINEKWQANMGLTFVFLKHFHPYTLGLNAITDLIEYDSQKIIRLIGDNRLNTAELHLADLKNTQNKRDMVLLAANEFTGAYLAFMDVGLPNDSWQGTLKQMFFIFATFGLSKTDLLDRTVPAMERAVSSAVLCASCYVYLDDPIMVETWVTRSREAFKIYARQLRYISSYTSDYAEDYIIPAEITERISAERELLFKTTNNLLSNRDPHSSLIDMSGDPDA